jgi:hypothetical protein
MSDPMIEEVRPEAIERGVLKSLGTGIMHPARFKGE